MTSWEYRRVDMRRLSFSPDEIVGKGRPRMDTRSKRTYTPAKTKRAEAEIRAAWLEANGDDMATFEGPVDVRVSYSRPLAKSNPKCWKGRADIGHVDCDNVLKLAIDAINGLAFKDDRQVLKAEVEKYPRRPYGMPNHMDIAVTYYEEIRHEDD